MKENKFPIQIIIGLSVVIPLAVAFMLFYPKKLASGSWVYMLPHINGVVNTMTTLFLLAGWWFIKKGKVELHRMAMVASFILGVVFLVCYVIYHASVPSTPFQGTGTVKIVYFTLLISHIFLSFAVVPLVLMAFYFALNEKFDKHKKVVKWTWPIWMYVSVTGVIVYLMISPYYTY